MKTRKKIMGGISIVLGSIVSAATPGSALTWNFTYTSDSTQFNNPTGYGVQSGSFTAPGSEVDGTHAITEFQFTHSVLGNSFNVSPSGSDSFSTAFSSATTVTIGGGTVTGIDVIVNGTGSSFEISSGFDQVTLYDVINANEGGGGTALDGSNFDGDTTFTRSGAGASWEFSAVPAFAIITVGVGINKLVEKWREGKKEPK